MLGDDVELRPWREADRAGILDLCAGASSPGRRPRTEGEWRWAVNENPAGWRATVAARGGEVVALASGEAQRVWMAGGERVFARGLDVLARPGADPELPIALVRAYFSAHGGPRADWVSHGLPTEAFGRRVDRELGGELVRDLLVLLRPVEAAGSAEVAEAGGAGPARLPDGVEELGRFDHQARWLYDRCCGEWGASAIRDGELMNWRYVDRPDREYARLGVRDADGVLRGVAVWRPAEVDGIRAGFVADWLVPPEEPEVADLLLDGAVALCRSRGEHALGLVAPEGATWFALLQERGFLVHPTTLRLRAKTFHPRFGPIWLRDAWWHQPGDLDLV